MDYKETFALVAKITIVCTLIVRFYFSVEDFSNKCEECLFEWGST